MMMLVSICALVVLAGVALGGEKCIVSDNNCQCKTENGTTLDISHYFNYPEKNIPDGRTSSTYHYTYSPCNTIACNGTGVKDATACQFEENGDLSATVGREVDTWTIESFDPLEFTITYVDGDPSGKAHRRAVVLFTNAHERGTKIKMLNMTTADNWITFNFLVTGTPVITHKSSGGTKAGPIGLAIIALFIISVVAYFVIGGLVNYYHRGARGAEIIPNYTFWKELPYLIKDGFLLTISPCYKGAQDKMSYQRLN